MLSFSGADFVFDTTFSRDFSLVESCHEFVQRYRQKDIDKKALPMLASACPGMKSWFTGRNLYDEW